MLVRKALLDESIPELKKLSLKGARVAIATKPFWEEACTSSQQMIEEAASVLEDAGAKVFALDDQGVFENLSEWNIEISGYEFARTLAHERRLAFHKLSEILRNGRMADGCSSPEFAGRSHDSACGRAPAGFCTQRNSCTLRHR